jgi:DNA-binding GntR family transcriptional regulator
MEGKIQSLLQEHCSIVRAVREGDEEGAVSALRKHLSGTLSIIDAIREKFPTFMYDPVSPEAHSKARVG